MTPSFLYFDLGNVLLNFDHQLACRQMGEVAGLTAEQVWNVLFDSGLEGQYESGRIGDQEFYEQFCQATDTRPDYGRLLEAGSAIFWLNTSIVPVIGQLHSAGHRLGILSNTCSPHWKYCNNGRFAVLQTIFHIHALSFRIGVCKPDARIYQAAAELAGVKPVEIFYVDDTPRHVEAARKAGFDAVQYVGTPQLVADLRARGVQFNY